MGLLNMEFGVKSKSIVPLLALMGVMLFTGCALFNIPVDKNDDRAIALLERLSRVTTSPDRFKGIGSFKMEHEGIKDTFRSVWAGHLSEKKIRIELLDILGKPLISLTSDGTYLYFLSQTPKKFYKKRGTKRTLKRYLSIPITLEEILFILTGRIEIRKYHHVLYEAGNESGSCKIFLKNRSNKTIQTLLVENETPQIKGSELFDRKGNLLFSVRFDRIKEMDGFQVPNKITISDSDSTLKLIVSRFYAEPDLESDLFRLNP